MGDGLIVRILRTEAVTGIVVLATALSGCVGVQGEFEKQSTAQRYVVKGPQVIDNKTPVDPAFTCLADYIRQKRIPRVSISVGNVKDFTGKYSEGEGGNAITQGGSLMVISALGKLGDTIAIRERFDTIIADNEFAYMKAQRLGDGKVRIVNNNGRRQKINFIPEAGGTIQKSQVYIVGGITELNYNLSTGGFTWEVAGVGPRVRQYTISVAADLRLINTSNLNVVKSVSLQKQIVGYEVKAGVFKFFGDNLYNIEAGIKSQEPLQLAVRTILEMGTLELVSKIYSFDYKNCFDPTSMNVVQPDNSPKDEKLPVLPNVVEPPVDEPVQPMAKATVPKKVRVATKQPQTVATKPPQTVASLSTPNEEQPSAGGPGPPMDLLNPPVKKTGWRLPGVWSTN